MKHYRHEKLTARARRGLRLIGKIGIAARAGVIALMGVFFVQAAIRANPEDAKSFGESLGVLLDQPYGRWLLGAAAIGVIAYAAHSLAQACYRRFPT